MTTTTTESDMARRVAIAEGLEALGAWLIAHPEVDVPIALTGEHGAHLGIYLKDRDDLAAVIRAMGNCEKAADDYWIGVQRSFGPIVLQAKVSHEMVCERVVVGVEQVETYDPAVLATVPKIQQEREIVRWECPPSLLADAASHSPGKTT